MKKVQRDINIGFRIADLLSPEETTYARAESRGLKFNVDKDAFEEAKIQHRQTQIADISVMESCIRKTEPIVVLSREERKAVEAEGETDAR